jgi:glucosyl-3-phosphoglycerate phosphatase
VVVCEDGPMGRLLIVRHAQSVWNAAGRWQGWSDAPLSELGMEQATQAGKSLAAGGLQPREIACSDLLRARLTAELIAEQLGYKRPVTLEPALREHDVGEWNGLTMAEITARWPNEVELWRHRRLVAFPGGEELGTFDKRVQAAMERLAALAFGSDVVVVAHAGVVRSVEEWLHIWRADRPHTNLTGWWLECTGTPTAVELAAIATVDLVSLGNEAVPGPV